MKIHVLTFFYGALHSMYLKNIMMPALRKTIGDLDVEHHIYCSKNDTIDSDLLFEKTIIDREFFNSTNQRNELQYVLETAVKRAIADNALIVSCQCDHIYGHGLKELILKNKGECVVCPHSRCRESKYKEIKKFITGDYNNRSFGKAFLTKFQHGIVDFGINSEEKPDYWAGYKEDGHIDIYFKEPAPIIIPPRIEILDIIAAKRKKGHTIESKWGVFEIIDHEMVDWFYRNKLLYHPTDSDEFVWSEITNDESYLPTIYNRCWLESSVYFHDTPFRIYV